MAEGSDFQKSLDAEIAKFEKIAALSTDSCTVAQLIAILDKDVQKHMIRKFTEGHVFKGMECVAGIGIPEQKRVLFKYDCKPGTFCLINPSFLVIVNIVDKHVVSIQDPYLGSAVKEITIKPLAAHLTQPAALAGRELTASATVTARPEGDDEDGDTDW